MTDAPFVTATGDSEAPFPPRENCSVTPLIESAEMYPVLERAVLEARHHVWLAFRIFDPTTRLRSPEALALGHETWLDLIVDALERGVEIRVLLADFEPVMADYLHAGSWKSFRDFHDALQQIPGAQRDLFQMIVIQHEGEIGLGWRQVLRLALRARVRRVITKLLGEGSEANSVFGIRPGLWRWLKWDGEKPSGWRPGPPPRLWPATYHQKCATIDGRMAIIGGLDLDERRWDDERHNRPAEQTWHDISSVIEGSVVTDTEQHFARLWNAELSRFREIVSEWTADAGSDLTLGPLTSLNAVKQNAKEISGGSTVQLVRTLSRKSTSAFATGPVADIRELHAAHRNVIGSARRTLYIEAQFFRSGEASDWVIAALRANPALEVIILIANAPEELAFLGQSGNAAHKHGEYLQARALGRIIKACGLERVGLFTLAKAELAEENGEDERDRREVAFGTGIIYIHAKLIVADERVCILSSANINGRSFDWDTELGVMWADDNGRIAAFRNSLWDKLSDGVLAGDAVLADWHALAERNRTAQPEDRKGFIVPYQRSRARRFGVRHLWVPDSFV